MIMDSIKIVYVYKPIEYIFPLGYVWCPDGETSEALDEREQRGIKYCSITYDRLS
jgi:hypothetical protein